MPGYQMCCFNPAWQDARSASLFHSKSLHDGRKISGYLCYFFVKAADSAIALGSHYYICFA